MTNRSFFDEEFKEFNTIELTHVKKTEMWNHIQLKTKHEKMFSYKNLLSTVKYILIVSAAIILFSILVSNTISSKNEVMKPSESSSETKSKPKTTPEPTQQLTKNESSGWEVISRLRSDYGIIQKIETKQNLVTVTVKEINSFGSDTDPIDTITPDADTKTYILKTSQEKQVLHLKINQNVLLLSGQYSKKVSTNWFWGAEVLGESHQDGKLYNPSGDLLNIKISSRVQVTNGILKIGN